MITGDPRVHLFGIRHHGPGSARSLIAALEALQPDLLLVEGPPEADKLLPLVAKESMQPPVALLVYSPENPNFSAYYPFAVYSPEWQAISYGLKHAIPVQMMDLPQSVQMALNHQLMQEAEVQAKQQALQVENDTVQERLPGQFDPGDPLKALAEAAGYSESEQWWEHLVEQRRGPGDVFAAVLEAMIALREAAPLDTHPLSVGREAAMRQMIRAGLQAGKQRIAVVCGAWHAPALVDLHDEAGDRTALNGLPAMEVRATWIPWTNARLTRASGYGAGIDSPGWYQHLWVTEDQITERWMIHTARLLRTEDLDISPAHVIEAVRLSEALAALRDRPLPGLLELMEATLTVFCFGNPMPMRLIEEKLIVGDRLGSVPPETPMAPLQQDFDQHVKRLKMPVEATERLLDLDLRKPFDLERSHLLHRLTLLGVAWGSVTGAGLQSTGHARGGTFHEIWKIKWQPELAVVLIEAGQWGNTIRLAASAKVSHLAGQAPDLTSLTELVEDVLLAELPDAIEHLMDCLQAQAAVSSDVRHLMQALPPLASVLRYGNVRQTDTVMIAGVVDGLAARVCIGLPGACTGLNDDAAGEMFPLIIQVDDAINRLAEESCRPLWQGALGSLVDMPGIHGLIAGRACRILMDRGVFSQEEAGRRLGLGLSTANDPSQAAAWIEGFLRGSGQLLVHDESLLGVIDGWMVEISETAFIQLLPLLRRTFDSFTIPERRSIGERVRRGPVTGAVAGGMAGAVAGTEPSLDFDIARADIVLPLAARLLGFS